MMGSDRETLSAALRRLIDEAHTIVPFTGAGISTECGIPNFRSPGGLWTKNKPIAFDAFLASAEMRDEVRRLRQEIDKLQRLLDRAIYVVLLLAVILAPLFIRVVSTVKWLAEAAVAAS